MNQKTLNKFGRYCKLQDLRFGQLIEAILELQGFTLSTLPSLPDETLIRCFNGFVKIFPPPKRRRHYYKKPLK